MRPRIGSLFAGYGGLDLAVEEVFDGELAWYSEIDKGALKILEHRFPGVPNVGSVTTADWSQVEPIDILTGGSPCQDLSHAGRRAGMTEGTRSNLWVAMREAIAELRPRYVIWENVRGAYSAAADSAVEPCPGCVGDGPGVHLRALGRVLGDLSELGFHAEWHGLRAADVGAAHGRFRVFVIAEDTQRTGWRDEGHAAPGEAAGGWASAIVGRPSGVAADAAVSLLPTPTAQEPGGTAEQYRARWAKSDGRNSTFLPLSMAVSLLPTPRATDGTKGGPNQAGSSGDLMLPSAVQESRWGDYAAAIARWESILGRPAPEPTQTSTKGNPQLSARFVEFLMGLPAGWVTDVPGITRNESLKALGNGVVPQQATEALRIMLDRLQAAA